MNGLVTSAWLRDHLEASNIVILDATWTLPAQQRDPWSEFLNGHLPRAQFFDIEAVSDQSTSLPHMLPPSDRFALTATRFGISKDTHVVVYDNNQFMASARVWWTFRVFGHERVSVLDGGMKDWVRSQNPLECGAGQPRSSGIFEPKQHHHLVESMDGVRRLIGGSSAQLIDARPIDRFEGRAPEPRPGLRSGHIPGSRSLFFKQLIDEASHTLHPPETLQKVFHNAGIDMDPNRQTVATCGSGVTAAIIALGLYQLGHQNVAIYDGSWSEWGQDQGPPIALGASVFP